MLESGAVEVNSSGLEARAEPAGALPGERLRSLAFVARATLEVVGFVCVLSILCLAISPTLRVQIAQAGTNVWAYFGSDAEEGEDEVLVDSPHAGPAMVLAPANRNVALYLARRYHVADDAVRLVVVEAQSAGQQWQVDPLLILAVIAVESSMNPYAQSPVGATGLMQVMPDLHSGKFASLDGNRGALDPVANIHVGSQILADLIRRGGSVERGLQLYVGAGNASDDGGYAGRVLGELGRLRIAAKGGVAAALAAGLRSDAHAAPEPPAEPAAGTLHSQGPAPATSKARTA